MAINEIPTTDTFGGTKETLRTLAASAKRLASGDYNAVTSWLVAAIAAIGKDDGTTSGSLRQALTPRVITSDATLASTDRLVIIDAAGTVEVTLDTGSATRAPVEILHRGDASSYAVELIPPAGGTINGGAVDAHAVIYGNPGSTLSGQAIRVWSSAALTWHVDTWLYTLAVTTAQVTVPALATRVGALEGGITPSANIRNTTTAGPHTILAGETLVRQGYAGSMAYTLPPAIVGTEIDIVKDTTDAGVITCDPAGSDTIHGSASVYTLDDSDYITSATTFRRRWTLSCLVAGEWTVT